MHARTVALTPGIGPVAWTNVATSWTLLKVAWNLSNQRGDTDAFATACKAGGCAALRPQQRRIVRHRGLVFENAAGLVQLNHARVENGWLTVRLTITNDQQNALLVPPLSVIPMYSEVIETMITIAPTALGAGVSVLRPRQSRVFELSCKLRPVGEVCMVRIISSAGEFRIPCEPETVVSD